MDPHRMGIMSRYVTSPLHYLCKNSEPISPSGALPSPPGLAALGAICVLVDYAHYITLAL